MTVGQTIKTWSVMETVLSVTGLVCVLLLVAGLSRAGRRRSGCPAPGRCRGRSRSGRRSPSARSSRSVELGVVATAAVERVHVDHRRRSGTAPRPARRPGGAVVGELPRHDVLHVAEASPGCAIAIGGVVDQPAVQPLLAVEVVGPPEDGDVGERVRAAAVPRLRRVEPAPLLDRAAVDPSSRPSSTSATALRRRPTRSRSPAIGASRWRCASPPATCSSSTLSWSRRTPAAASRSWRVEASRQASLGRGRRPTGARSAWSREVTGRGCSEHRAVDLDRPLGDRRPAEGVDRPRPAGPAHLGGPVGVGDDLRSARRRSRRRSGPGPAGCRCRRRLVDRHQATGLAVGRRPRGCRRWRWRRRRSRRPSPRG